jgi:anti-sigma B factor antagonist
MNNPSQKRADLLYRCPVCNVRLSAEPALPAYDAPCPDCGSSLWCGRSTVDGVVLLHILPDRTPEHADIERLTASLVTSTSVPRIVLDLSNLEFITSALMARLIVLNKHVRGVKGRLVLCGLSPLVLEVFCRTRLETLFEVLDTVPDALDTLQSPPSSGPGPARTVEGGKPGIDSRDRNRPSRHQVRPGRKEKSGPTFLPPDRSAGPGDAARPISFMLRAS